MQEKQDRDKKGRFMKGGPGGPGRSKGDPKDIVCGDGKKRSVDALIYDLLAAYESLGGDTFLRKWAVHSHVNLRKFFELLFKFAPQPDVVAGDMNMRVVSAVPRPDERTMAKRIRKLEAELKTKDEELEDLRRPPAPDVAVIEHEPIRPRELPEHGTPGIKEMTDEELDAEIARIQKEIKNGDTQTKAL